MNVWTEALTPHHPQEISTGGGCTGLRVDIDPDRYLLITDDAQVPDEDSDGVTVTLCANGDDIADWCPPTPAALLAIVEAVKVDEEGTLVCCYCAGDGCQSCGWSGLAQHEECNGEGCGGCDHTGLAEPYPVDPADAHGRAD